MFYDLEKVRQLRIKMPYKLRKAPKRELYWVVNTDSGKKHSIEPIPRDRAQRQMNLLRGIEHGFKPTKGYRSPVKGGDVEGGDWFGNATPLSYSSEAGRNTVNLAHVEHAKYGSRVLPSSPMRNDNPAMFTERQLGGFRGLVNKYKEEFITGKRPISCSTAGPGVDGAACRTALQEIGKIRGGKKSPKKDCCEELKLERYKRKLLEDEYIGNWK